MAPFIITGAQGGQTAGAEAPNRLEIWDFVRNDYYCSLFVQGLRKHLLSLVQKWYLLLFV